jgi:hypothetical protein
VTFACDLLLDLAAIARRLTVFRQQLQHIILYSQSRQSIIRLYATLLEYLARVNRARRVRWRRWLEIAFPQLQPAYERFCKVAKEVESQIATHGATHGPECE